MHPPSNGEWLKDNQYSWAWYTRVSYWIHYDTKRVRILRRSYYKMRRLLQIATVQLMRSPCPIQETFFSVD